MIRIIEISHLYNLHNMKTKFITTALIPLCVTLFACSHFRQKTTQVDTPEVQADTVAVAEVLSPLVEGSVSLSDDCFGKTIELSGQQKPLNDVIFKLSEPEVLFKKDHMIMQNLSGNEKLHMLFSFPDLKLLKEFNKRGSGPDEFTFPHLVPTGETDKLAYLFETTNQKLYSIDTAGVTTLVPVTFRKEQKAVHSDKDLIIPTKNNYYYVEVVPRGKAIFHATKDAGDSLQTELVYNLAFSDKHKNWAVYIGDFGMNQSGTRAVYAYKYFKRVVFIDTETKTTRTLDFKKESVKEGNEVITLGPDNVTHYWGISTTPKYVYLTYSGRTPIEVGNENSKGDGYIFVEQFDWNGNPVCKYRLNHWGKSFVDPSDNKIYQLCYTYDDPFFIYDLPQAQIK